jgi:hypothetical protein
MALGLANLLFCISRVFSAEYNNFVRFIYFGTAAIKTGGRDIDLYVCLKKFEQELIRKFAENSHISYHEINIPTVLIGNEAGTGVREQTLQKVLQKEILSKQGLKIIKPSFNYHEVS